MILNTVRPYSLWYTTARLRLALVPGTSSKRQDQLREELLNLILAEGFRSFTVADLARRLHCSKTTLYALGGSREQIIVNSVKHYFRDEATVIEQRTAGASGSPERVVVYLRAVAEGLRRASPDFIADLAALQPAREIYERNTAVAARRVAQLIDEGVEAGDFRRVNASFVADTIATSIQRIQAGLVHTATGLTDAQAFAELAELTLNGIRTYNV